MIHFGRFRFSMRLFRRLVIVGALAGLAFMVWKLDLRTILRIVGHAGYGIVVILALYVVALALNTLGWRLSFDRRATRHYGMLELARLWMAMDGVNYFVPSGTVAGEVVRATMLRDCVPLDMRTASIVVSRAGQTIAQISFIILGLAFLVSRVPAADRIKWAEDASFWTFIGLVVLAALSILFRRRLRPRIAALVYRTKGWVRTMFTVIRIYMTRASLRFVGAVLAFMAAYTWYAVEAFWICHFIGIPVSALLALTIDVLSVCVDGIFFMVPAKIGTQELGKAAIFGLLQMPLAAGVAYGIIRHIREIFWALAGFSIYAIGRPHAVRSLENAVQVPSERVQRGS